jgi:autotransporter-associated beta strand protein
MLRRIPLTLVAAGVALLSATFASAQTPISYTGGTYSENFDGLPTTTQTGYFPGVVGSQLPIPGVEGWAGAKVGGGGTGNVNFVADAGGGNSGAMYSYGAAGSTERALGALASGTHAVGFGAEFVNNAANPITSVTISFTAESWRVAQSVQNVLSFFYGFGGGSITASNYVSSLSMIPATQLDAIGSPSAGAAAATNGNDPAHRVEVTYTISGISWQPGQSLFICWRDRDDGGADGGTGIDDFSLSGTVATGGDVTRGAGTVWTPTSFGGNPFSANDNAIFDAGPVNMSLSGNVVAAGVKFVSTGHTVSGGAADSLEVTGAIDVAANLSAVISGVIGGSSGLIKTGEGSLSLSGANTFTGNAAINGGRLILSGDSALGSADNALALAGATVAPTGALALGAGRALSGSGAFEMAGSNALTFAGPVAAGVLPMDAAAVTFAGPSNTLTTLGLPRAATVAITGGPLQPSSGIAFSHSSGLTSVAGNIAFGVTGDRALSLATGNVEIVGDISLGGRLVKTGPGTLDLGAANISGTTSANGGIRLGTQGATALTGGRLIIGGGYQGNLQMHLNSGELVVTAPVVTNGGVSLGSRVGSSVPPVTISGEPMTFNGLSGFFNAGGASGFLGAYLDTHVTINGNLSVTTAGTSVGWIEVGGSGQLTLNGNGSAFLDRLAITEDLILELNGTLGGEVLEIDPDAVLTGGGRFTGTLGVSDVEARLNGFLMPDGVLTFDANVLMSSGTITMLRLNGATRGSGYDAVSVFNPGEAPSFSHSLAQAGSLLLEVGPSAPSGSYLLFEIGENVTRSGNFLEVTVKDADELLYLVFDGSVWSGEAADESAYSFNPATGVLTATRTSEPLSALEQWRLTNFGSSDNTGPGADDADFDGDGVANLLEYALGSDPTAPNASPVAIGQAGGFLTLTFNRIADPALTYTVKASDSLVAGGAPTVVFTSEGPANLAGPVTATDTTPISGAARRFLWLEVSR